jgi:SAM-dependent methyltransferase
LNSLTKLKTIFTPQSVQDVDLEKLKAGDPHYRAYVGPPLQYDLMGASQFCLLASLGLRSYHQILDVGCGSLRLGKLLIPFLDPGRYYAVEPNKWLVRDAVREELGKEILRIKKPRFSHNDDFNFNVFEESFDFIVLQSIFSHCGDDLIRKGLESCRQVVKNNGIVAATFIHGDKNFQGKGWVYPECVQYIPEHIRDIINSVGFECTNIPWYHPRQVWYILGDDQLVKEVRKFEKKLCGPVLFCDDFSSSLTSC